MITKTRIMIVFFGCVTLAACGSDDDQTVVTAQDCERAVADALLSCVDDVGAAHTGCYERDGATCDDDAAVVTAALGAATDAVHEVCSDELVAAAGFGPMMTASAVARRVEASCRGEAVALAVRTFGGPQGAA